MDDLAIELLDGAAADDEALVADLTRLVNAVYAVAEEGLWQEGAQRTMAAEVAGLIRDGEIAVATRGGGLVGTVRVQRLGEATGELGMLAAAPEHQGAGVGRALVDFAEEHCRERGDRTMQLELLVPRRFRHPSKVFLDAWYRRRGYRALRAVEVEVVAPRLADLVITPCEFVVYEKPL